MTSIDYNALVNKAFQEAQQRKQAVMSDKLMTNNATSIAKTLEESGRGSELSVEMITDAMKARDAKERLTEDFLINHSNKLREKENKNISITAKIGQEVQQKITQIQASTEISLDRQGNIARSLKGYQNNPFAK